MKGIYSSLSFSRGSRKDFYLVKTKTYTAEAKMSYEVVERLSNSGPFSVGSILTLIDNGTAFYEISSGALFKEIF